MEIEKRVNTSKEEEKVPEKEELKEEVIQESPVEIKKPIVKVLQSIFNFLLKNKLACKSFEQKYCSSGIGKDAEAFEQQMLQLLKTDSVKFWKMLQSFGFDFWLNLAGLNSYKMDQLPIHLNFEVLKELIAWVNIELCSETKHILMYPPNNIKIAKHSHQLNQNFDGNINYIEDISID